MVTHTAFCGRSASGVALGFVAMHVTLLLATSTVSHCTCCQYECHINRCQILHNPYTYVSVTPVEDVIAYSADMCKRLVE